MAISRRAVLSYASILGLPLTLIETAASLAEASSVRVRQNIQTFVQDPQKVAALRAGVGRMKARSRIDRDDPLGFYYWSAVHGTSNHVPAALEGVYGRCEHTRFHNFPFRPESIAEHFMSWHRPFLFFFEATLKRAAQEAGAATPFELPYWNWYADPDLPRIFTEGTETSNPLLHSRVNQSVGRLSQDAFSQTDLLPPSVREWRKGFSVLFELDPHGTVHNVIGGDMGNIFLSARDPIFWLHHANIDRLWAVWSQMEGNRNPAPASTWSQRVFTFDTAGQMTKTAGAMTDPEKSLSYRYEEEESPLLAAMPQAAMAAVEGTPVPERIEPNSTATVSSTRSLSLGNSSVAVDMKLPEAAQAQLPSFIMSPAQSRSDGITGAWLVLENVEIGPDGHNGGFSYDIIATLPDSSRRVKLGQLGTFTWPTATSAQAIHDHGPQPITLTIPLKAVLEELGVANSSDLAKGLRIIFEAAHPESASNPQFVKIRSIHIKASTESPR